MSTVESYLQLAKRLFALPLEQSAAADQFRDEMRALWHRMSGDEMVYAREELHEIARNAVLEW